MDGQVTRTTENQDPSDPLNFVTVCGWCTELNILKIQRRETDALVVVQYGKTVKIARNGHDLTISHGICPECRRREFPETVQKEAVAQ